jgi:hypothetical protein
MTERRAAHLIHLKRSNLYVLISKNVQRIIFRYSQVNEDHILTGTAMRP